MRIPARLRSEPRSRGQSLAECAIAIANTANSLFATYANADDAMRISGSGGDWAGLIYAPNGVAELSGQNDGQDRFDLTGGVIGERVKLSGSDANIDGTVAAGSPTEPSQVISLVE